MAVSMRRSKLKAEEAALLAGEINKPSWESRNEGIHERVTFEDSIWGFDLAGGAYYKTPLRVTYVKPDSRAEKAGIRAGDRLKRINDIDTSTLTIQEAHEIIIESGIHLRLAVTAPEDEEDSYFCYQDPLADPYDSDEERRREEENARKRQVHAKVSSYWSLQWPWVSKRRVIYRESNCFMVPSKYEGKHRDKFPEQPVLRYDNSAQFNTITSKQDRKRIDVTQTTETIQEDGEEVVVSPMVETKEEVFYENANKNNNNINGDLGKVFGINGTVEDLSEEHENSKVINSQDGGLTENGGHILAENVVNDEEGAANGEVTKDDDVINEVFNSGKADETDDSVLDSILSDSENSENHKSIER
ncbi:uncharacterized protein LOC128673676 [Plodia interpunctella]|uniref:uncharacterized protein LOC128673676 n=1 Tax=Plodia interpunctella TaxID=58824 RepID=UPI002368B263|nr:uncharacterized protein LOC128673676 [Plodia interpunctella]